jgi:hypothetical protein
MCIKTKLRRKISRNVDIELGVFPPKLMIHINKKKYNRKQKHKKIKF